MSGPTATLDPAIRGRTEPAAPAASRPEVVDCEATHRAIALDELAGTPVAVVPVPGRETVEQIAWARRRGYTTHAETCPRHLVLAAADADIALSRIAWVDPRNPASLPRSGDPARRRTPTRAPMHQGGDSTPCEGLEVAGWPVATLVGGRALLDDGRVVAEAGHGASLLRGPSGPCGRSELG